MVTATAVYERNSLGAEEMEQLILPEHSGASEMNSCLCWVQAGSTGKGQGKQPESGSFPCGVLEEGRALVLGEKQILRG